MVRWATKKRTACSDGDRQGSESEEGCGCKEPIRENLSGEVTVELTLEHEKKLTLSWKEGKEESAKKKKKILWWGGA